MAHHGHRAARLGSSVLIIAGWYKYEQWQEERFARARDLGLTQISDAKGKNSTEARPDTMSGTLACGAVSATNNYNEKLKQLDRKILAIETESGGIFSVADQYKVHALTIRGISDYADQNKTALEQSTKDKVRILAAENAASFLKLQIDNDKFLQRIRDIDDLNGRANNDASPYNNDKTLEELVIEGHHVIDAKLRELSPEYRLHAKVYQMPLPSIIRNQPESSADYSSEVVHDIVDCLRAESHIYIGLDKSYPDKSVPWVIADHLIRSEIDGVQLLPVVISGEDVKPPQYTIELAAPSVFSNANGDNEKQIVVIFDGIPVSKKTRAKYIIEQVNIHKGTKFIFVDRTEANFFMQTEFALAVSATAYRLCEVSFSQMAYFIQRNFEMNGSESEVVARRLRDTFKKFYLNAHPSYFAGIPKETLTALIRANRRTELMQLGVDGFLSFLVAGDPAKISLSRTTRSKFLRQLVVEMNVNKKLFDEEALIKYTKDFAEKYDFAIQPLRFIEEFIKSGILYFDDNRLRIAIPFIESFLLAQELAANPDIARDYFSLDDYDFDLYTFDLYCEIQPCEGLVNDIIELLENSVVQNRIDQHILLSNRIDPATLIATDKIGALQKKIATAARDIIEEKNTTVEKQRLIDIAERVSERTSRSGAEAFQNDEDDSETDDEESDYDESNDTQDKIKRLSDLSFASMVGILLVGYGAEHLDANTKRKLCTLVIQNSAILIDKWTEFNNYIDFSDIERDLTSEEFIDEIMKKYPSDTKHSRIKSLISDYLHLMKFMFVTDPFRKVVGGLGEHAKNPVIGRSLSAISVDGEFENLLRAIWISDLEIDADNTELSGIAKILPKKSLIRICVSEHLLMQVYWRHSSKKHRLKLLDIAEKTLERVSLGFDKEAIRKAIENEER